MQTQCPHCETKFRVTEVQLKTAEGLVRCSVCEEIFNVFEVSRHNNSQESLLDENHLYHEVDGLSETSIDSFSTADFDNEQPYEDQAINEAVDYNKTTTIDESQKDAFDFFDEDINTSANYVVPDEFRGTGSSRDISGILWGIGILLLVTSLFVEYAWFNRNQLSKIPEFQPWLEKLCPQKDCRNIAIREPSKIELVTRNIYSHPNEKNALIINVTMHNNAEFAQAYPVMQIDFSDIRGGSVAARRFLPTEYLPLETQQSGPLAPDSSISFSMEIKDPGKQALTYEFNFL